jgi:receptor-binding protein
MSGPGVFSRRVLLRTGSGLVAGAALAGGALAMPARASATVPASEYFDITKPSYDLFRNKMLHESHHVMQGFTFDNVNRRLFVVQIRNGSSGDDLCVNQLDFAGNLVGAMHLDGAGHGVSIGVEAVGTDSYIWMECDSDGTGDSGRGTALARFKFVNGGTPSLRKFLTGSKTITCATDPVNDRIVVRRNENGAMYYSLFSLADAAAGDFGSPLAHFAQPTLGAVFQGYTIYGQYLYTLDGSGHDDPADIDSYVSRIDMNTGAVVSRALTKAGSTLVYREPEGMAVYRTAAGETRLFLGFASRDSLDGVDRYANLFYKNALVSPA